MLVHLTGETEGDCRVVEVPIIMVPIVTFYLTERESSTETIVTKKISGILLDLVMFMFQLRLKLKVMMKQVWTRIHPEDEFHMFDSCLVAGYGGANR